MLDNKRDKPLTLEEPRPHVVALPCGNRQLHAASELGNCSPQWLGVVLQRHDLVGITVDRKEGLALRSHIR